MNALAETKKKKADRLLALDAARGLAVIGMYVQHFALNSRNANIVSGNTMILFILCSGISFTLMYGSASEKQMGRERFHAKVLARALFIDLLGYFIIMLNGPFAVILPAYAGLFVLALGLKNLSDKKLLITSIILYFVSPVVMVIGLSLFSGSAMILDLAGGPLSSVALLPVFALGMYIGRQDLRQPKNAVIFICAGILLFAAAKLIAVFLLPHLLSTVESYMLTLPQYAGMAEPEEYAIWPRNCMPAAWNMLFIAAPQSGTTVTLFMGTGTALAVTGVLQLLERKYRRLLKPFCRVGQTALTMYTLQFIIVWFLEITGIPYGYGELPFGDILVAAAAVLTGCLLVKLPFSNGAGHVLAVGQFHKPVFERHDMIFIYQHGTVTADEISAKQL